jgi:hypothetical protein
MVQSLQRALSLLPAALGLPERHMAPAWLVKPRAPRRDPAMEIALRSAAVWLLVMTAASFVWHAAMHAH